MKLKKKQAGLVINEETYKQYYPELSNTVSYEQFIGESVLESSTHCIDTQKIIDPRGNSWNIHSYVDVDLSEYLYKGEPVFIERKSRKLFKCTSVRLTDDLYVSCSFGYITITKMPLKEMKDLHNHVFSFTLDKVPQHEIDELKEALKPHVGDVSIISIIKECILKEFNYGTV